MADGEVTTTICIVKKTIPKLFRNHTETVPKPYRNPTETVPKPYRNGTVIRITLGQLFGNKEYQKDTRE